MDCGVCSKTHPKQDRLGCINHLLPVFLHSAKAYFTELKGAVTEDDLKGALSVLQLAACWKDDWGTTVPHHIRATVGTGPQTMTSDSNPLNTTTNTPQADGKKSKRKKHPDTKPESKESKPKGKDTEPKSKKLKSKSQPVDAEPEKLKKKRKSEGKSRGKSKTKAQYKPFTVLREKKEVNDARAILESSTEVKFFKCNYDTLREKLDIPTYDPVAYDSDRDVDEIDVGDITWVLRIGDGRVASVSNYEREDDQWWTLRASTVETMINLGAYLGVKSLIE